MKRTLMSQKVSSSPSSPSLREKPRQRFLLNPDATTQWRERAGMSTPLPGDLPGAGLSFDLRTIPITLPQPGRASPLPVQREREATDASALTHDDQKDLGQRLRSALGKGHAMEDDTRQKLEQKLGFDLSRVRVHSDDEADHLSRSLRALAFTTGPDMFFRAGAYRPRSAQGLRLLTHEATHVVQQMTGPVTGTPHPGGLAISEPTDRFERAAEFSSSQPAVDTSQQSEARSRPARLATSLRQSPLMVQRVIDEGVTEPKSVVHSTSKKRGILQGWNDQTRTYSVNYGKGDVEENIPAKDLDYLDQKQNNVRKTLFESKLAGFLIKNPHLTAKAVFKVSQGILHYLETLHTKGQEKNVDVLAGIAEYSYSRTFFGVVGTPEEKQKKSKEELIGQMMKMLQNPSLPPHMVLPIHGSFFSRVYSQQGFGPPSVANLPKITSPTSRVPSLAQLSSRIAATNPDAVKKLGDKLNPEMVFKGRGRTTINTQTDPQGSSIGITANIDEGVKIANEFGLASSILSHKRALDSGAPDTTVPHVKEMLANDIPFAAGPSGSSGKIIQNAVLVGHLSTEEMREYLLACVAYYVGGGNHSFHEVMIMGHQIGVAYISGNYTSILPQSFKKSSEYAQLSHEFPDLLPKPE